VLPLFVSQQMHSESPRTVITEEAGKLFDRYECMSAGLHSEAWELRSACNDRIDLGKIT